MTQMPYEHESSPDMGASQKDLHDCVKGTCDVSTVPKKQRLMTLEDMIHAFGTKDSPEVTAEAVIPVTLAEAQC